MPFKRTIIICISLVLLLPWKAISGDIPVLLRLSMSDQSDTNGCNFVEQLTSLMYREIMEGRVKLWDSPSKEIQITGITLKELEKNTNTRFVSQEVIYIYELWQSSRKSLTSTTLGFNFSNKTTSGEDVAYGFVEYAPLIDLFMRTRINTNANGDYNSSFASYINNKTYHYNIIQFNGKVIKDVTESNKIKVEFIGNLHFNESTFVPIDPDRLISYLVEINEKASDEKALNGNLLISGIENYLTENQEIFYNLGGDRILSYLQKNQLKVTRLEFVESWKKKSDSIFTEVRSMIIYVNDSALNPMNAKEMNKLDLFINSIPLTTFLTNKKFNIIITQINSQRIPRKDAFLYQKALVNSNWRKLTEYVKYY